MAMVLLLLAIVILAMDTGISDDAHQTTGRSLRIKNLCENSVAKRPNKNFVGFLAQREIFCAFVSEASCFVCFASEASTFFAVSELSEAREKIVGNLACEEIFL